MKNKLLALMLSASVGIGLNAYGATVDTYRIDNGNNILTVSGTPENLNKYDSLSFALLKGNMISVTENEFSDFVTYMQFPAGESGSYSIDIDMDGMNTGDYTVRVRSGGKIYEEIIYYSNPFDKKNAVIDILSKTTPQELSVYLDIKNPESDPLKKLEADQEFISMADSVELAGVLMELISSEENEITPVIMKNLINNSAIIARINNGTLDPYGYKELIGLDSEYVYEYENVFSDEEKEKFTEYTKGKNSRSFADIKANFNESVIVALTDYASTSGEFEYVLNKYHNKIGFDKLVYDSLSTACKLKLYEYIASVSFKTIDMIKSEINYKAVQLSIMENPVPSGGGGGGGGGSSSSKGSNSIFVDETKPPVITPVEPEADIFSDMSSYEWAKESVEKLYKVGIISGISETEFAPENQIKREELVKILVGITEMSIGEINWEYTPVFTDVSETDWYAKYVIKAYLCGITKGINETCFGAGGFVSREDVAVLISRTARIIGKEFIKKSEKEFSDADEISSYAVESVKELGDAGIISGNEQGGFMPKESCLRAQAAKMIYMSLFAEGS